MLLLKQEGKEKSTASVKRKGEASKIESSESEEDGKMAKYVHRRCIPTHTLPSSQIWRRSSWSTYRKKKRRQKLADG
jgi:hypothetical protein